jgi:hypothetical protein
VRFAAELATRSTVVKGAKEIVDAISSLRSHRPRGPNHSLNRHHGRREHPFIAEIFASVSVLPGTLQPRLIALTGPRPILFADGRLWAPQFHALLSVTPDWISVVRAAPLLRRRGCPPLSSPARGYLPRRGSIGWRCARRRIGKNAGGRIKVDVAL